MAGINGYEAPVDRILLALRTAGLGDVLALPHYADIDEGAVRDVLEGFAKLAGDVIAPSNRIGDVEGAHLDQATGRVTVAAAVAEAWAGFAEGGWAALSAAPELGGGGFPTVIANVLQEMFASANMALGLNAILTQGAIEALQIWGDERQQHVFLTRLIDGTWTGTMNLTEPDAGSDVGAVRTTATPRADGRYDISGTKIFITWGEHDLTDNIVHLVLARLPGAPAGTKGISLFIVPKVLVDDDGALLERNGVRALSLEHKMGVHSSPTCVLEFDGAIGEMVGPEHGGMTAMFSMMNAARLAVGIQGVAIGERALQQATGYAHERRQGRSLVATEPGSSPIVEHPDVQRMLALIAVGVDACRLLTFATGVSNDLAHHHPDPEVRERAQRRADLLTPLAKSWPTDMGVEMASMAVQVHGGMGFVEETGVAQTYRDVWITPIYEGTNGIQAIDLVSRKLGRDGGAVMLALLDEVEAAADAASAEPLLARSVAALRAAASSLRTATGWIVERQSTARADVLAGASAYLQLAATVTAGHLLLRQTSSVLAVDREAARREVARLDLFAAAHLARVTSLAPITLGADALLAALA